LIQKCDVTINWHQNSIKERKMGFKQKLFSDAGVQTPPTFATKEINDKGARYLTDGYSDVPKSAYAIHESRALAFTNSIVESKGQRLNIADTERRPGTRSYHQH
jgi:hypothetical protein